MSRKNSIFGHITNECQNCLVSNEQIEQIKNNVLKQTKNKKSKVNILSTLDVLISVFIVTPLVVACWRGTWELMDIYDVYFPAFESFIIGKCVQLIMKTLRYSSYFVNNCIIGQENLSSMK